MRNLIILLTLITLLLFLTYRAQSSVDQDHSLMEMSSTDMSSMDMSEHAGHMSMTALRNPTPEDEARADKIVETLRTTLKKYSDYHAALNDGYKIFLPNVPLPEYHFTNYFYGLKAAFTFDPSRPTSLLYRKTATGYELTGAMFTAPRTSKEEELNERIPLSVARWHKHINLCLPPKGEDLRKVDWTRFGLKGSIDTEEDCKDNGGRWIPQIFGWMVHVYPFEKNPSQIWRFVPPASGGQKQE